MNDKNHHRPDGRGFANPWSAGQPGRLSSLLKWMLWERPRKGHRGPSRTAFAAGHQPVRPSFLTPRAAPDDLTITWIGHSSFLLQIGAQNLLLDPVWGERASPIPWLGPRRWAPPGVAFDALPPIDAVVLSHDHYDHLDAPTIDRLVARHPKAAWFAPLGVDSWLRRRGATTVQAFDWWQSTTVNGVLTLTSTPAQHFSGRSLANRDHTLWCGWVIRSATRSAFFAGDTGLHPEFAEIGRRLGPFDAVLMPIGAYDPEWFMGPVHINPEHAVDAFRALNSPGAVMAGMHWGTFRLTDEPMDEPPRRTRAAWSAAGLDPERLWIPSPGATHRWP